MAVIRSTIDGQMVKEKHVSDEFLLLRVKSGPLQER